ncbi:hypothetical protein PRIPAC_98038, partial [Pristionchus pacificus]|uniref:Uncharacterized protein n=1 Tax=Pristionchus pacificus TaxID=54126 RepID=A0A2A6BCH7_PRIPA
LSNDFCRFDLQICRDAEQFDSIYFYISCIGILVALSSAYGGISFIYQSNRREKKAMQKQMRIAPSKTNNGIQSEVSTTNDITEEEASDVHESGV